MQCSRLKLVVRDNCMLKRQKGGAFEEDHPFALREPFPKKRAFRTDLGAQSSATLKTYFSRMWTINFVDLPQGRDAAPISNSALPALRRWPFGRSKLGYCPNYSSTRSPLLTPQIGYLQQHPPDSKLKKRLTTTNKLKNSLFSAVFDSPQAYAGYMTP